MLDPPVERPKHPCPLRALGGKSWGIRFFFSVAVDVDVDVAKHRESRFLVLPLVFQSRGA